MFRTLLPAALLTAFLAAAPAVPAPPKGPPPEVRLVTLNDKGELVTQGEKLVIALRFEERQVEQVIDGMKVVRKVQVPVHVPVRTRQEVTLSLEGARISTAGGNPINPKALPKLLASPTPVVISADGQPIDPVYLQVFDKSALIFRLKRPLTPGPGPLELEMRPPLKKPAK